MPDQVWRPPCVFSLGFAFTNALTWSVALGTPLILLCRHLGATPVEIGLTTAFPLLVLPLQVLATSLLPYFGYKRLVILSWSLRALFLAVPLVLTMLAPEIPSPWMLHALLAAMLCFTLFRAAGTSSIFPWVYIILPEGVRGRYYATEQVVTGAAAILTMLLSAWAMSALPTYSAFTALYLLAATGSVCAVTCLGQLPDSPAPRDLHLARILRRIWPLIRSPGPFRNYLALMSALALFNSSLQPFTIYYLRVRADISDSRLFLLSGVQVAGGILTAWLARRFADRTGARPFLISSQTVTAGVCLFWLLLLNNPAVWLNQLPLACFAQGAAGSLFALGNVKYTPQLSDDNDRAYVISVLGALAGLCGGTAPILWGWFLKDSSAQSIHVPRLALFFAGNFALQLALIPRFMRLQEKDPLPLRPFGWISAVIGLGDRK
jgi:MFS family permease